MVNKGELEPHIGLTTFNRTESARILGIPPTTLANWGEELGIFPLSQDAGTRGVPSLYSEDRLFRAAIAKRQLEAGLSKKCARVTSQAIVDLLYAAGVTKEGHFKPVGGLLGTGSHLIYVPREQMDNAEQLQMSISQHKDFCWVMDLRPVLDGLLAAMRRVIFERLGFEIEGPGNTGGVYRLSLLDGTKFESESFDSVLEKFRRHQTKKGTLASLLGRSRTRGLDRDVLDDMEDLARFVGYANAEEFSSDIEDIRETLKEVSSK
jgi:hypothetical protein